MMHTSIFIKESSSNRVADNIMATTINGGKNMADFIKIRHILAAIFWSPKLVVKLPHLSFVHPPPTEGSPIFIDFIIPLSLWIRSMRLWGRQRKTLSLLKAVTGTFYKIFLNCAPYFSPLGSFCLLKRNSDGKSEYLQTGKYGIAVSYCSLCIPDFSLCR